MLYESKKIIKNYRRQQKVLALVMPIIYAAQRKVLTQINKPFKTVTTNETRTTHIPHSGRLHRI